MIDWKNISIDQLLEQKESMTKDQQDELFEDMKKSILFEKTDEEWAKYWLVECQIVCDHISELKKLNNIE